MTEPVAQIEANSSPVTPLRTLYVLVYPSPLFAAHWSFWLPYLDASGRESRVGDRIHATGDRLNGFGYEYLQGYDVKEDSRHPNAFPIGLVSTVHLTKEADAAEGGDVSGEVVKQHEDLAVLNAFDRACSQVPPPGPSLNRVVQGGTFASAPKKLEVGDCQWWIEQAVAHLVEVGILLPLGGGGHETETPSDRIAALPKH